MRSSTITHRGIKKGRRDMSVFTLVKFLALLLYKEEKDFLETIALGHLKEGFATAAGAPIAAIAA
jgi:hypothetical protein